MGKSCIFRFFSHIFFTFWQIVKGHNFVNFIPIWLKFGMCMPDYNPDLICYLCSYHICTIKKTFWENPFFGHFGGHLGLAISLWDFLWHDSFFVKWCIVWIGCFFHSSLYYEFSLFELLLRKNCIFRDFFTFFHFLAKSKGP